MRPALEIILAAQEAIDLSILSKILQWKKYDQSKFIQLLGSLFQVIDGSIRPFHRSISEWLIDSDKAGDYLVSNIEGHRELAEYGWQEYQKGAGELSPYSLAHLPFHLCYAEHWDKLEIILTDLLYIET